MTAFASYPRFWTDDSFRLAAIEVLVAKTERKLASTSLWSLPYHYYSDFIEIACLVFGPRLYEVDEVYNDTTSRLKINWTKDKFMSRYMQQKSLEELLVFLFDGIDEP